MTWTTPADLRAQVQRLWDRGLMLASVVDGEALFPRRLALKVPSSTEVTEQFDEVRKWIGDLRKVPACRIEMRGWRHPVLGANTIPNEVWIDNLDDALALIGTSREFKRFNMLLTLTRARQPSTVPWIASRPLQVLEYADEWPLFLDVVDWIQAHPRPGIYIRQMDIPGIHTKFIEMHRGMLSELLDLALPPEQIDVQVAGAGNFCRRYGFRDKPLRIRFRVLDKQCAMYPGGADQDFTLSHDAFAELKTQVKRVFITENEVNFLAFPNMPGSMVVFGSGYGFDMLEKAAWLDRCLVHYWGDIDTHGFAILDELRGHLPHAQSLLMDRTTLMFHEHLWTDEAQSIRRDLLRLNDQERDLFDDLRYGRLRTGVRLEQERIEYSCVKTALLALPSI